MHDRHVPETVFFRWAIKELASILDCAPTIAGVLVAREKTLPDVLASRLLREANVGMVLLDHGYQAGITLTQTEHEARLPCRALPVLRLETLAQEMVVAHETFDATVEAFVAALDGARAAGYVGLKSIIAYRTGLAVSPTARAEAAEAFGPVKERARRDGCIRLATKPLNDYFVLRALEVAEAHALPVQFHTGFGDADVDLLVANPLHLRPLLESSAYRHVSFVLLHASYPYVRELGYLASIYPHVYADFGLANPHLAAGVATILRELLGLAPTSKVVYSSDASAIPELFWLAARWGRRALGVVLDELVALGALTGEEARASAGDILGANAARVYGLSWP